MSRNLRLELWNVLKRRKIWSVLSRPDGSKIASLNKRLEWGFRQTKLKPGKNWARTIVYFIRNIIRSTAPNGHELDDNVIMQYHEHINKRKRWKRITHHHGYLYWERMK